MKGRLLFGILLCASIALFSQTYSFTNYTVQDGLAQSNILGMVQDSNGYIWIGTESGVSRFDGKTFRNYGTEEGLAENNITCMLRDRSGQTWYGHASGVLTLQQGEQFIKVENALIPKDKNIYTLFQDKQGQIWISSITHGVIVIKDPKGDLNSPANYTVYQDKDLGDQVYAICQDPEGIMWFHTRYGIKFLNPKTSKFEYFPSAELSGAQHTAFYIDTKGNFWLGQPYGTIKKFNKNTAVVTHYTQEHGLPSMSLAEGMVGSFVNCIFEDRKGNIWFAAWDRGVSRFNANATGTDLFTNFSTKNGLPINKFRSMAEDREGNVLLGTFGAGLCVFKGERFVSFTLKDGLVNNQVWGIVEDPDHKYWISTNEGLSVYDPQATEESHAFSSYLNIDGANSNSIRPICADRDGNIWMGTWGSKLIKYDRARKQFTRNIPLNDAVFTHITALYADSKNNIWVGSPTGLILYEQQSGMIKSFTKKDGLSEDDITCIFEDSKGRMWFGTRQKGVNRFDNNAFYFYGKDEGLNHGNITSITEDKSGRIWVSSAGGGIFVFKDGRFNAFRMKDGLSSDYTTLLLRDKDKFIWIGTNNGLCKMDPDKNVFYFYGKHEGFTGIETKANAGYRDSKGDLWFGTSNGVFRLRPTLDLPNTTPPILNLQSFRINNQERPASSGLELSYKENSLFFEFTGISLSNPDAVKYQIKLEGYDEDWKPLTTKNFIEYSNLDPGNYTFHLSAFNASDVECSNPLKLEFGILPPIWKRWWFYVLITLLGLTILFAYIKIREKALIQEKKVLESKVAERTAEVVEKNKELAEKNKDIMDSIHYAKRIQDAILPPDELVRQYLPQTFILFKPKDIVSGDFYWLADKKDKVLFAAVDCTGHGVPGAFMSIVGHNMLEKIVNEYNITQPSEILEALNKNVSETLRQSYAEHHEVKDGMDASVCMFDRKTNEFHFAGAMNPLYFIRKGVLKEIKGDKMPIGNLKVGENRKYTNHVIQLEKGDSLYIFTDGYADQFGGPSGKKFKYQQLKDTLLKIQDLPLEEQGNYLQRTIHEWMGHLDQVDDILVIGTRL